MNQAVLFGEVTICAEDTQRDRQIKAGAFLSNVSGGEIDCGSLKWKEEPAVADGRTNAFPRLADRSVR
jgi:hypothetical protein